MECQPRVLKVAHVGFSDHDMLGAPGQPGYGMEGGRFTGCVLVEAKELSLQFQLVELFGFVELFQFYSF